MAELRIAGQRQVDLEMIDRRDCETVKKLTETVKLWSWNAR
jgi:hypothetical protein